MGSPASNEIEHYYDQQAQKEWGRLERHRTEFAVTKRALARHLPPAPARVLDCGGGPGRYAIELARRGYAVTLFDLSPECLRLAQRKAVEAGVALAGFEQGTATDLFRFPDKAFDALLLLGPLYHLLAEEDRRQALAEARRVLKPGGMLFAAFIVAPRTKSGGIVDMNDWKNRLNADPLPWLLERDAANPGVRYFALRDLLDRPANDPELLAARADVMRVGPVPAILDAQSPEGYWVKPGPGYSPKYRGTLWSVLFLAQLGADGRDARLRRAVEYIFSHAQAENDAFACNGRPSTSVHCLWGNMARALLDLGFWGDQRLERAVDALARSITGEGYTWYRQSGVQGPGFLCSANYGLPCGWGAVRALWALNRVPAGGRTPAVNAAVQASVDFLLGYDVARAEYPYQERVSSSWFKFGYPLGYVTDVLLNLEALAEAGCGGDPRLDEAVELVLSKQDPAGRWKLEYSYHSKLWSDIEKKGAPSKWVTLRATRLLKRIASANKT